MYLHIGNGQTVKKKEIIGIFDMDTATVSTISKQYLSKKQKENKGMKVLYVSSVSATLELDSYSKRVPVKIVTTGELVSGKAISSITINGVNANDFETTIYGDEAALEGIKEITAAIDIDTWCVENAKDRDRQILVDNEGNEYWSYECYEE